MLPSPLLPRAFNRGLLEERRSARERLAAGSVCGSEVLSTLGFWTDNGGYYHYATGAEHRSYEEVLPEVTGAPATRAVLPVWKVGEPAL